ncbi:hypothetical protein SAMN05216275_14122 [Streptosporangium canum]|uniref:Uncharacterized protein n=1 Tax=Streptosporangium canum TaxID=324952 RepID=A0A1I4DGA1_9ACTN|nr:hypothetical protein [Streptosporangium canum]SFK91820.1 hypothetical protein SAMN05216275_14122 [Streptosporangium canum]
MAEPITPDQLAAIKARAYTTADGREFVFVHEITEALGTSAGEQAHCSDPIECGHEAALGQAEAERDELRALLERLIPAAHDGDSTLCRERAARQEALSPCQRSPAAYDDECPACEALAVLHPEAAPGA